MALQQSVTYDSVRVATVARDKRKTSTNSDTIVALKDRCLFCGKGRHVRSNCPARNATCRKYNKLRHFAIC
uniref:Putative LOC100164298 [Acyrthosiphon pisum] n=1 Tax=Lepeophtheirus salmonis TaxID=72036 RepID=A0A0K2TCK9_LEPSM